MHEVGTEDHKSTRRNFSTLQYIWSQSAPGYQPGWWVEAQRFIKDCPRIRQQLCVVGCRCIISENLTSLVAQSLLHIIITGYQPQCPRQCTGNSFVTGDEKCDYLISHFLGRECIAIVGNSE
jgi:hypothetical protein